MYISHPHPVHKRPYPLIQRLHTFSSTQSAYPLSNSSRNLQSLQHLLHTRSRWYKTCCVPASSRNSRALYFWFNQNRKGISFRLSRKMQKSGDSNEMVAEKNSSGIEMDQNTSASEDDNSLDSMASAIVDETFQTPKKTINKHVRCWQVFHHHRGQQQCCLH